MTSFLGFIPISILLSIRKSERNVDDILPNGNTDNIFPLPLDSMEHSVFLLSSQEKSQTEKHHYGCPLRGSVHGSAKTRCKCGRQSLFEERKTI